MKNPIGFKNIISESLEKDLLFAAFSYPESKEIYLIIQTDKNILNVKDVSSANGDGFILAPFDTEKHGIWIKKDLLIHSDDLDFPNINRIEYNLTFKGETINIPTKKEYINKIQALKEGLKKNGVSKAVLSRTKEFNLERDSLSEVFLRLNEMYSDSFVFIVNLPGKITWFGASPEILLKEKNQNCETMALAATKRIDDKTDWSEKEYEEQAYVSEYIESILESSKIEFNTSELIEYPLKSGIKHLCKKFRFKIKEHSAFFEVAKLLHPTPAVAGIPKEKSLELINKIENYNRSFYSGYLGPVNLHDSSNLYVNLRSAQLSENKGIMYIGGGITIDSNEEDEWQETEMKSRTILNALEVVIK